jgi:hypothetical protein
MARIAILDRADMNAEQARVYDAAKQSSGIVGGPYYAYIRLPKLFEACQNLRASLSSGPLSQREQQIVNLVVARLSFPKIISAHSDGVMRTILAWP